MIGELLPTAKTIAVLLNPESPEFEPQVKDIEDAAQAVGQQLQLFSASNELAVESAFAAMVDQRVDAVLISADPFISGMRSRLIALAARHRVPALYEFREMAVSGGLASYGPNRVENYWQVGAYTGRILKGDRAGDLPVIQSTTLELEINLKTAKSLGLNIPPMLLAGADEVIE